MSSQYQFARFETYGRQPTRRGGKELLGVAREAERILGYCDHVAQPKPPTLLHGMSPTAAAAFAIERASQAQDAIGRCLKLTALIYLGGVASFPVLWTQMSEADGKRCKHWVRLLVNWLRGYYGDSLKSVVLHTDEPYPHVHWAAVPPLDGNGCMRMASIHPGLAAFNTARAKKQSVAKARLAMKLAMSGWQDEIHRYAFAPVGISRIGPKRQRLSADELKSRRLAETSLAETLANAQALKAKWRAEIESDVRANYASRVADLESRLATAEHELGELRTRLAETEDFSGP